MCHLGRMMRVGAPTVAFETRLITGHIRDCKAMENEARQDQWKTRAVEDC